MPYCGFTKGDLLCLCNREYKVVFSCRLRNPLTVREARWIADGLLCEHKNGVLRFYLYHGDPKSKSHPDNQGDVKIDGREDPARTVKYFIRINRLMEIVGSVEELDMEDEKSRIECLLSSFNLSQSFCSE
jgi:hypothetical protein